MAAMRVSRERIKSLSSLSNATAKAASWIVAGGPYESSADDGNDDTPFSLSPPPTSPHGKVECAMCAIIATNQFGKSCGVRRKSTLRSERKRFHSWESAAVIGLRDSLCWRLFYAPPRLDAVTSRACSKSAFSNLCRRPITRFSSTA